jgi:hypothetical protein
VGRIGTGALFLDALKNLVEVAKQSFVIFGIAVGLFW